jgi:hypothetical protein
MHIATMSELAMAVAAAVLDRPNLATKAVTTYLPIVDPLVPRANIRIRMDLG